MTNGGYPTQALIRFADQVQRQVRKHELPFGNFNRMTILSCNIRPVAKCQKQAHPDAPISSANASPDNPVVRLYDQRNKPARRW